MDGRFHLKWRGFMSAKHLETKAFVFHAIANSYRHYSRHKRKYISRIYKQNTRQQWYLTTNRSKTAQIKQTLIWEKDAHRDPTLSQFKGQQDKQMTYGLRHNNLAPLGRFFGQKALSKVEFHKRKIAISWPFGGAKQGHFLFFFFLSRRCFRDSIVIGLFCTTT